MNEHAQHWKQRAAELRLNPALAAALVMMFESNESQETDELQPHPVWSSTLPEWLRLVQDLAGADQDYGGAALAFFEARQFWIRHTLEVAMSKPGEAVTLEPTWRNGKPS